MRKADTGNGIKEVVARLSRTRKRTPEDFFINVFRNRLPQKRPGKNIRLSAMKQMDHPEILIQIKYEGLIRTRGTTQRQWFKLRSFVLHM